MLQNDNCLYYFEFTTDKEPRGIIPLENIRVREVPDRSKPHCFELYSAVNEVIKACKTDSEGKVVEGNVLTKKLYYEQYSQHPLYGVVFFCDFRVYLIDFKISQC